MKPIPLIVLMTLVLYACNKNSEASSKKTAVNHQSFLLNMEHFFTDRENMVSFPVWFNDSLIKINGIREITRSSYRTSNKGSSNSAPSEIRKYRFTEEGELFSMSVNKYYEGTEIENVTFHYLSVKDENGYAFVEARQNNHPVNMLPNYSIYDKENYSSKYLVYRNVDAGNYLYCMTSSSNQSTLGVDSIINPTPKDLVLFGSPERFKESYNVSNRVNKTNVSAISYDKKTGAPLTILFEKSPFTYRRTIEYNRHGICTGYMDSTFSIDQFIIAKRTTIDLNDKKLPKKVEHESENRSAENRPYETFHYEFY